MNSRFIPLLFPLRDGLLVPLSDSHRQVARALAAVDGVGEVSVELVWSPPWTPERMSDDARLALDF